MNKQEVMEALRKKLESMDDYRDLLEAMDDSLGWDAVEQLVDAHLQRRAYRRVQELLDELLPEGVERP